MEVLDASRRIVSVLIERPAAFRSIWLAFAAAVGSIGLTAILIKVAAVKGWVVVPSQNRWNKRTVAQFGGGPVLLIFWLASMMSPAGRQYWILLLSTVALALLGFIDDIKGLGPKPKLLVEVLVAACTVSSGIISPITPSFGVNWVLTVLWIVVISNAFNIIDNMDGLAGGVAMLGLAGIVMLSGLNSPIGILSILLLVAVGGFFLFNFNPAKIFMGDLGSLPIGFFLASASVVSAGSVRVPRAGLVIPCLIMFVPVFDALLVSFSRRIKGRAVSEGGRDHSSHRLVFSGLTERRATGLLHAMAACAIVLAVIWSRLGSAWANVVLAVEPYWHLSFLVVSGTRETARELVFQSPGVTGSRVSPASRSKSGKNGPRFRLDRARNLRNCIALPEEIRATLRSQIVGSRRRRCFASTRIFLPRRHVPCTIAAVIDRRAV